jgi:CRP/FNR family transcriptional regulator, nitrogen oxide reductase regulator
MRRSGGASRPLQPWLDVTTGPEDADFVKQLSGVPLFRGVGSADLLQIAALSHERAVDAGAFFFDEGEPADQFFVLTRGRVKLTQMSPEGHQIVLRHANPGEAFGGVGAFGDPVYPVSAEAIEPAVARAWTSSVMRRLLETRPGVALNALHFVAGRLHDLQRRYRQVTTERVERRVARAILRLAEDAGRRVDAGVQIDFPVSRQDIAEMTGTTLYTVSRLVSAWEHRGIIRGGRQRIVLVDSDALARIAEDLPRP